MCTPALIPAILPILTELALTQLYGNHSVENIYSRLAPIRFKRHEAILQSTLTFPFFVGPQ